LGAEGTRKHLAVTPQQRARKLLEADGYKVDTVEQVKRIPGRTWRVDLFGGFDLLAVNAEGNVKAVQVTSRGHVSTRIKKLADLEVVGWLRKANWDLEVWGYGKTKTKGNWKIVDIS